MGIRFSRRADFDLRENALALRIRERRASGARLLDLTESNPTRAGLRAPGDLLLELSRPDGALHEPQAAGLRTAREAVARGYARRGVAVSPDDLFLTASSSESYAFLLKLLCDPGDEILVPRPSYPLFEYLARIEGVVVRTYPLDFDGEWHMSVDRLARLVTGQTRAVVVVHPNNPTGSFVKRAEADALAAFCASRGLAIISDEVFSDFAFEEDERRFGSFARPGGEAVAFALGGLSKSCGLPQMKLGWIGVAGPDAARRDTLARLELIGDTFLSVGTPIQRALPAILSRSDELQSPIRGRLGRNLARLRAAVAGAPSVSLLSAEGGWTAILRCPDTVTDEDRALGALDRGVLVHPGHFFDFDAGAYLVVSLLVDEAVFEEALPTLLDAAAG